MSDNPCNQAFIITKPLQLMVALSIASQEKFKTKSIFVIVDSFSGAHKVATNLLSNFTCLQVPIFVSSVKKAFSFVKNKKIENLFIDGDVGLQKFISMALLKIKNLRIQIKVYEEGIGTYRDDMYSGVKKNLFLFFGVGVYFGSSRFVDKVYVFNADEYAEKIPRFAHKTKTIQVSLVQTILDNLDQIKNLFDYDETELSLVKNKKCKIYLSSWEVNNNFIKWMGKFNDDLYVKLHPHLSEFNTNEKIQFIKTGIPAELLLLSLIDRYEFIEVYDHNSSVRRYVAHEKIQYTLVTDIINP